MSKVTDWQAYIGRYLQLKDLHVFLNVVRYGSLSKAAAHLNVTHSAVSQVITKLERTLRVVLVDFH